MTVHVTDAAQAGDHLLADIAALGGTDGVGFETGFRRKGVGIHIHAPEGKSAGDP